MSFWRRFTTLFKTQRTLFKAQRQQNPKVALKLAKMYERLIERLQPDKDPLFYAIIQNELGNAYMQMDGNREGNITRAIECYREALRFWTSETDPSAYAWLYNNLGYAYSSLRTGDRGTNLTQAIACFKEALHFWTPETAPLDYARIQDYLGYAYLELQTGDRGTNLTQAIACFKEALHFWTPETAPSFSDYTLIYSSLGAAYTELPTGDRAANIAQAITYYQEALRFWTPETSPLDYAMTQNNLGFTYLKLLTGDRGTNIAQAIVCFNEALRFWTPESAPLDYAQVQNNLGNAYRDLPTGDRAANIGRAIVYSKEALRFWTPETDLSGYSKAQTSLGNAYYIMPTGDRAAHLAEAIACYQEALRFTTPNAVPFDYALVQTYLGNAYRDLPTGDRAANIAQAIACFNEALRFWTPETAPLDYAWIQNNLGLAYYDQPTGDRAANIAQAIACFKEALRFWTPEATPFDYASAQNNLGVAYKYLSMGDRTFDLALAITSFKEALRYLKPEHAPFDCRRANSNLADLYFIQGEWQEALRTYRAAMDAGERLYRAGLSTESKATEMAANSILYRNAAFTAVRCGQVAEALLILEQGKTRLLTEALRLRIARPANVSDKTWNEFEQARVAVRAAQAGNTDMRSQERDLVQAYAAREQAAQKANTALETAIEHVRSYAPEFLRQIDLPTIQELLPDERTVLVTFCITDQGSMGFLVSQNHDQSVRVVELPTFTKAGVRRLLIEWDAEGRAGGGWLVDYMRSIEEDTQAARDAWQATITRVLAEVGKHLLAPILAILPSNVTRITFLPSAELFLLPLHAAPLAHNSAGLVGERCVISYAPSIEVLSGARARVRQNVAPDLYAVINPQTDPRLIFTILEGVVIARLFAQHHVDEGAAGTKQRAIAAAPGRSYVHFSCHGRYNWSDPTQSGLELADGRLTLAELQQEAIDLSTARLVTLSACETGISDVLKGSPEEYVGIPAGFLLAGVPCVVSSLWAVPDLSTALLMERFYHNHLKGTLDFAAALREAQVWVRELRVGDVAAYAEQCYRQSRQQEKPELFRLMRYYRHQAEHNPTLHPFEHPYYWAAFTVNGM